MSVGALLLALLVATGAGFKLGYERHVPGFSKHDPDRLVWLAFAAALFMAVFAWPVYEAYDYMRPLETDEHRHPPLWGWAGLPVAVVLPWAAGDLSGRARRRWLANRPEPLPRGRLRSPTSFDYVLNEPLRGQSSATTLCLQLKGDEGRQYVVVGCLKHASSIPHRKDVYLEPVYFHGTEAQLLEARHRGDEWGTWDEGALVNFDDVLTARVLLEAKKEDDVWQSLRKG